MCDRVFGGVGIVLAIFFIWQATLIEESFIQDTVGPKTFPIIIGTVLGLASLYSLLRPDPEPIWPRFGGILEIALAAAVLVAYALALPEAGFLIATAVAAAYITWRLETPLLKAILAGIVISGALYVIFRLVLGLSLARGPFGY